MKILHLLGSTEDIGGVLGVVRNLQSSPATQPLEHLAWVNSRFNQKRSPTLEISKSSFSIDESNFHLLHLINALPAFFALLQLQKKYRFDTLHVHSRGTYLPGLILTKWLNRKSVFTFHGLANSTKLYRYLAHHPLTLISVLTHSMAKHYGLKEAPPKINVIYSGCSNDFFQPTLPQTQQWPSSERKFHFAGIGNVVRWKQWDLVLKAIQSLPSSLQNQVEFHLWGPTPSDPDSKTYERELRQFSQDHHLNSLFHLQGPAPSVSHAIQQADWLIHPTGAEPCGMAVIESLALGVPTLVAASHGPGEIVRSGENGLHFTPNDPASLADQIKHILESRIHLASPAQIRESARPYSAHAMAEKYANLYSLTAPPQSR